VPKIGHVTITKIKNLQSRVEKFTGFKIAILFDLRRINNNEVIADKPFQNSGVTRRLWTLGRLE